MSDDWLTRCHRHHREKQGAWTNDTGKLLTAYRELGGEYVNETAEPVDYHMSSLYWLNRLTSLQTEHLRLLEHVHDLAWKATPYGETEDGDVRAYLIPKGTLHRLVGVSGAPLRAFTPTETP